MRYGYSVLILACMSSNCDFDCEESVKQKAMIKLQLCPSRLVNHDQQMHEIDAVFEPIYDCLGSSHIFTINDIQEFV